MSGQVNGSLVLLLLKVLGQWRLIGGQVSHTDTLSNNPIDITNKSSQDYRELLAEEGLQTRDITLELQYNSDANYQRLRELARTGQKAEFRILRTNTGLNDDVTAAIGSFSEVAPMADKLTNSVTLVGAQFGDAGPLPPIITLPPKDQKIGVGDSVSFITKAINWTSVQWYRQRPADQSGTLPEREEIVGAADPDYAEPYSLSDLGTAYIVVYSNAFGSAEAVARVDAEVDPVALALLYPLNEFESVSPMYAPTGVAIADGLGPQSGTESASASNYGATSFTLRATTLTATAPNEMASFGNYAATSFLLRTAIIETSADSEMAMFSNYGVGSLDMRVVVVDVDADETATFSNYGVTSMEIT